MTPAAPTPTPTPATDCTTAEGDLAATIRQHHERAEPVTIQGHNSKHFYGNTAASAHAHPLTTTPLNGIIEYEPGELFIGVWSGTPLTEITTLLTNNNQMLPFDPPLFGAKGKEGTIGGAVAAGLSGPGRFHYGGVRDAMLGISIINGYGDLLHFGGRVIKNVAGYDITRLNAGALGTLGLLTRIYLRTAPQPSAETTRALTMTATEAATYPHKLTRQSITLTATFYDGENLYLRLPAKAAQTTGGEETKTPAELWNSIRDHTHNFFTTRKETTPLWKITTPYNQPPLQITKEKQTTQWRGELIWSLDNSQPPTQIRENAKNKNGGTATLFHKGALKTEPTFPPPPTPIAQLHQNLKKAFDPKSILNPGRMY